MMIVKIATKLPKPISIADASIYIISNLHPTSQRGTIIPALQMHKQRVPETQRGKVRLPLESS